MNLRQLMYFCKIADTGSVSQAAKSFSVASTALSMQISALERELGSELFDRSTRPMELTYFGRFFHSRAQELISQYLKLEKDANLFIKEKQSTLTIGFTRSLMFNLLSSSIKKYSSTYGYVQIKLIEVLSEDQPEMLNSNEIDLGLSRVIDLNPFSNENLHMELLLSDPFVAAVPTDHYLVNKNSVKMKDLFLSPFIVYPKNVSSNFPSSLIRKVLSHDCHPVIAHEAIEIHTALGLVGAGLGVTLVGQSVIQNNRHDIRFLPIDENDFNSYIFSVSRKDSENVHASSFVEVLKNTINEFK